MPETIFALASGAGKAGVAVIRISGPQAFEAAAALGGPLPPPRQAGLRTLRDPETGEILDDGLVLGFRGPASFTGEDTVELQLHGSVAVVRTVTGALAGLRGLRRAAPGEFTRRALTNGRLDLAQVEALGDLVAAETAAQQRQAIAALHGRVGRRAEDWKRRIVEALAHVEAAIDFADEELPDDVVERASGSVAQIVAEMRAEVVGSRVAERLREGFEVAIVGPPNVGKSSLLNAIAGREAALTADTPGTTRDVIEVRLELDGLPVTLLDTAGIRAAEGDVESRGILRARERAELADLRLFLVEDTADLAGLGVVRADGDVVALAKGDLRPGPGRVSGLTGVGIDAALATVVGVLQQRLAGAGSLGHARQRDAVVRASEALDAAAAELRSPLPRLELIAEDLRSAVRGLDLLMGRVDVEAVLDTIFSRFCLGK